MATMLLMATMATMLLMATMATMLLMATMAAMLLMATMAAMLLMATMATMLLMASINDIAADGDYGPRVTYLDRLLKKELLYAYTLPCSKPHPSFDLFKL